MNLNINWNIIRAILKRDLRMYFTNPSGYVFITIFIFLSATAAFWQERFFMNNLANLNQLNMLFPYLLMFFIPALTMGVWANENQHGTDELLFTLPATDLEIVLGKYFAAVGIYSASLLLSISHIFVLMALGSPDLGLMFGNYIGYWLIGTSMIAVGMLASLLTANITIAFILGSLMCAFFVFIDSLGGIVTRDFGEMLISFGVVDHFNDFARGVLIFSGLVYFLSVAGFVLYLNIILVGRRHWPAQADGYKMWVHHLVRAVALVVVLVSVNAILGRFSMRLDVTGEQLHSLSDQTETLLSELDADRPVFIQAYLSKNVPQHYVQTRENLVSFLKGIDAEAGSKVQVSIVDTEPYTPEAKEAREKFNIVPQEIQDPGSARASSSQVFLGLAITCAAEEHVIPFFDRGLPTEYELTRSIRVVAKTERKKIGIVDTEAKLFGGFDFQAMRSNPAWLVVEELKKQYEVVQISPASEITEKLDGLLVALPSALPQEEMDNLKKYMFTGVPTLLLVDPLPMVNIGLSPSEKAGGNTNPFQQQNQPPPKPKGNILNFLGEVGVSWNFRQVAWDTYNPHPDLAQVPPEIIFVGPGNETPDAFNPDHRASSGLQELVLLYPGAIHQAPGGQFSFTPLLKSSRYAGALQYNQLVQRSFFGTQLVSRGHRRIPSGHDYTFAAHIQGEAVNSSIVMDSTATDPADQIKSVNVVVIADLDFISQQFFEIRKRGFENLNFDNVTFFLNCMDMLVGDESFVDLRKRRIQHRTLEMVESQSKRFIEQRRKEEEAAEAQAQVALTEAQSRLDQKVAEVRNRVDIDAQQKQIMARNLQEVENRKFEALKANIEAKKQAQIQSSKENMEASIRAIQSSIKSFAVLFPPIPVLIIGILIFMRRKRREDEAAASARKLRS
ncbi:MAG: ABC transporter [Calditrichaeota bacterium]|nr:MAG: ABC transporter [Calditrichota bacterium]